jgi:hypothetical protein
MFLTDDEQPALPAPIGGLALVNLCAVMLLVTGLFVVGPIRRTTDRYAQNLFQPKLPYRTAVATPPAAPPEVAAR